MCGCLTALFRLLGPRIWKYSTLRPPEVLDAIERQARDGGEADLGAGGGKRRPRGAIQKKALQALPLLVSSASSPSRLLDGRSDDHDDGMLRGGSLEAEAQGYGRGRERGVAGRGGGGGGGSVADETPLADDALEFLSREISALPSSAGTSGGRGHGPSPESNHGNNSLRRTMLTNALLDVLEICYNRPVAAGEDAGVNASSHGDSEFKDSFRYSKPESWPWNSGTGVDSAGGVEDDFRGGSGTDGYRRRRRQLPPSWPVRSLPRWAPRLADAVAARSRVAGEGGGGEEVSDLVSRASGVMEVVLHQHAGAAWRKAIGALRGVPGGSAPRLGEAGSSNSRVGEGKEEGEEEEEDEDEVLSIFRPLLERICLELPLLDLTARVHAALFQAHGWLSLLPCGKYNHMVAVCFRRVKSSLIYAPKALAARRPPVHTCTNCMGSSSTCQFSLRLQLDTDSVTSLGLDSVGDGPYRLRM